ncbi:unnamed protein product [Mycena citricolor]|uniref:RRM domain-containing protein n=1 Tax=Mycena citricolor TaxID=2018698 RepID=A0AAD2JUZ9_9AGAR|nr:unnamed protein product [Mycena citricolor]
MADSRLSSFALPLSYNWITPSGSLPIRLPPSSISSGLAGQSHRRNLSSIETLNAENSDGQAPVAVRRGSWPPGPEVSRDMAPQEPQREYSLHVSDLSPDTSNSDLLAVFQDPRLGLRIDRPPRLVRPFPSCKSAKVMVDAETGISRGFGFVRFAEEADQQRALVEMQGMYCLSRPMRIALATTKPLFPAPTARVPGAHRNTAGPLQPSNRDIGGRAWNQEWEQARSISGIRLDFEQPQMDPYNTTVFVGGLSSLIREDALRALFAQFGEIHYVRIPAGKHCGFVQFVRKTDAVRAIDHMHGLVVEGSRIRLSWGRSQYKATQAVALHAAVQGAQPFVAAIGSAGETTAFSLSEGAPLSLGYPAPHDTFAPFPRTQQPPISRPTNRELALFESQGRLAVPI